MERTKLNRLQCMLKHGTTTLTGVYCKVKFDNVFCWPPTEAGTVASLPCPTTKRSNHTEIATNECYDNGTWAHIANYSHCLLPRVSSKPSDSYIPTDDDHIQYIYFVGYGFATLVLLLALLLILFFRDLQYLHNRLHCYLVISFCAKYMAYFISRPMARAIYEAGQEWLCKLNVFIRKYFICTTFFWMFAEGHYIFSRLKWSNSRQQIYQNRIIAMGWIVPLVLVVLWAILKAAFDDDLCWIPFEETMYNYIYLIPVILTLVCDALFLVYIFWCLFIKFKNLTSKKLQACRDGGIAMLFIVTTMAVTVPLMVYADRRADRHYNTYRYVDCIVQTFQGFLVALFYSFLNKEIQFSVRHTLTEMNESRFGSTSGYNQIQPAEEEKGGKEEEMEEKEGEEERDKKEGEVEKEENESHGKNDSDSIKT